ncbi:MAG: hypothetical protein KIT87_00040 [Anaerolineae bacterium]|nr:hypothetical protein [Anaerolineae bacterium]
MLQYAILAPSSHNSQPWLFHVQPKQVELRADQTRALPVVDPEDRELVISCGAALYHLRLALRYFGFAGEVELLPDPDRPDLMAVVRWGGAGTSTDAERALFQAILLRRTNRRRFEDRAVPAPLVAELQAVTEAEGAWLDVLQGDQRLALADLIAEADDRQMADRRFRRELAAWIHPNRLVSRDGMPAYASGVTAVVETGGPFVLRTFEDSGTQAAIDRRIALGSPLLAVLGTNQDGPRAWLQAGQALARLLLLACAQGVSASYLNQPAEVAELRPRLANMLNRTGFPQLILRMGYGPEVKATQRRPLSDVLV